MGADLCNPPSMDLHTPPESVGSTDSVNGPIWTEPAGRQVGPERSGGGGEGRPRYEGLRAEAMKSTDEAAGSPSDSTSEEDYDSQQHSPEAIPVRRRNIIPAADVLHMDPDGPATGHPNPGGRHRNTYVVADDDAELRAILKRGLERVSAHFPRASPAIPNPAAGGRKKAPGQT